jgi:GDP-L-fucose synthase
MNNKVILVTGGNGLVGIHLKNYLPNAVYVSSNDYNLTKESDVIAMYEKHRPDVVIHLAAKVGGILDNINRPAEYFTENVMMNTLLVDYAKRNNVKRFIGILSTCVYPDVVESYPMKEEDLHCGPPATSNFSYGYAKRSMAVQIDAYNKQHDTKYQFLIPCNLYGPGDKDNETRSHFITALIKKISHAKKHGEDYVTLFGDGTPLRQFMFADDLANIIHKVVKNDIYESFNIAVNENLTIEEMAKIGLNACDANHLKIQWDSSKPNGQHRRDVCIDKFREFFPNFVFTSLYDGIKQTYEKTYKI